FLNRLLLGSAHYPTKTQIIQVVINGKPVALNLGREATVPCPYGQPLEFRVHGAGELPELGTAKLWDLPSRVESKVDLTPASVPVAVAAKTDAAPPSAPRVAGKADRETLLRRATQDLAGRTPTDVEVKTFLADDSPDAYEKLIDRLLASPEYGERFAKHWLD